MIANYGYKDGAGEFFIAIDTDKCTGCGDCVSACPGEVFEVGEDPHDPFRDEPVALVSDAHRKKLKYTCNPCKPDHNRPPLPCIQACQPGAISHSW
ncbi:MAG: 4Fe-4S binding protein [Planctomycetota bacterium]